MTFYLHHQHDSVERDHGHDSILEWRRHHKLPHSVLKAQLVLGHVACQGPGVNGKIYTGSLQRHKKRFFLVVFLSHPLMIFRPSPSKSDDPRYIHP